MKGNEYIKDAIGRKAVCLPSTSPENAAWTLEKLADAWKVLRNIKESIKKDYQE